MNVWRQAQSNGLWYTATYSSFTVGDETTNYKMKVSGYSGNATDAMHTHNDMQFTTLDSDNDKKGGAGNCAVLNGGGFWHNNCDDAGLNNNANYGDKFTWTGLPATPDSLLISRMWLLYC